MKLVDVLRTLPEIFDPNPYKELSLESKGFGLRVLSHIYFGCYEYSISVQASEFHYCFPRETLDFSKYTHFEVMLNNIPLDDIPIEWEDYNYCGDNVYGYVPVNAIERLIRDLDQKYKMIRKH